MNRIWRYCPTWMLTLPLSLAYALHCMIVYRARDWRWIRGRLECVAGLIDENTTRIWGRPWGQGIGGRVIVYNSIERRDHDPLRVHELCHTVQGEVCAVVGLAYAAPLALWVRWSLAWTCCLLFPVLYGAAFFIAWARRGFGPWYEAYRANPFEKQAYRRDAEFSAGERVGVWE